MCVFTPREHDSKLWEKWISLSKGLKWVELLLSLVQSNYIDTKIFCNTNLLCKYRSEKFLNKYNYIIKIQWKRTFLMNKWWLNNSDCIGDIQINIILSRIQKVNLKLTRWYFAVKLDVIFWHLDLQKTFLFYTM